MQRKVNMAQLNNQEEKLMTVGVERSIARHSGLELSRKDPLLPP